MENYENIQRINEINNLFWDLLNKIDGLSEIDKIKINHRFKVANTQKRIVALIMVKDYLLMQESKGEVKCLKDQSPFWGKK